jgi:SAM-dependent methyltransferase
MKRELINTEKGLEESYWWFVGRRAILDRVLDRFAKHSRRAVDVGCGSGRNMQLLARYSDWVMGLDRSPAALELAAARRLPIACADGHALPLADSSVDLLSALDVIEHLDDDMGALAEFRRILQPGGLLLITVPAYRFLWSEHDEALMHRRRYAASELRAKLAHLGFRIVKRSHFMSSVFFPIVAYRLFRGLFPKNVFVPQASHVEVPAVVNDLFISLSRIEAQLLKKMSLPWGTSIVVLAEKISSPPSTMLNG